MITTRYGGAMTYKDKDGKDVVDMLPPFYQDGGFEPQVEAITSHLKRDLKIDLHHTQETSLIKALKDPKTWLDDRKGEMNKIAVALATPYKEALKTYIDAGYPYDDAVAKATREANVLYQLKLEELEARMPGANVLLTGAVKDRKNQGEEVAMLNGGDGIDYKAKYLNRKAKKSAKQAKKQAQQLLTQ